MNYNIVNVVCINVRYVVYYSFINEKRLMTFDTLQLHCVSSEA